MYAEHVPLLSAHGRSSPQGLGDLCLFAILSIRQQFSSVPRAMRDVRKRGEGSRHLWGCKLDGYCTTRDLSTLHAQLASIPDAEPALFAIIQTVPCLGLVKGGFVAQMLGYDIGCLDSRNVQRLGLDPRVTRISGYPAQSAIRRVDEYTALCRALGGPAVLWDEWCKDYARTNGGTAQEVSAMHLAAIQS